MRKGWCTCTGPFCVCLLAIGKRLNVGAPRREGLTAQAWSLCDHPRPRYPCKGRTHGTYARPPCCSSYRSPAGRGPDRHGLHAGNALADSADLSQALASMLSPAWFITSMAPQPMWPMSHRSPSCCMAKKARCMQTPDTPVSRSAKSMKVVSNLASRRAPQHVFQAEQTQPALQSQAQN